MTYEEWFEKYKPVQNDVDKNASFEGCLFETYQPHLGEVMKTDRKLVWTLLDVNGKMYVCPGMHHVNRVGYFITRVPFQDGTVAIPLDD